VKLGRGKVPPGGWHFVVAPNVKLEAITEEILVNQIFEYRLRNNIPMGDIERDIDDYYCKLWPEVCQKEPKDEEGGSSASAPPAEPMLNRVTRWVAMLVHQQPKGGYNLISAEEANRRADICVGCPLNYPWRGGCSGCSSSTVAVSGQLRKMQAARQQGNLMACKVAGWDNATAAFMPMPTLGLTEEQLQSLPDRCWRKS
jgi:hypothetical protein